MERRDSRARANRLAVTGEGELVAPLSVGRRDMEVDEPDLGDLSPVRERFGLRLSRADSFAVERRRGWTETSDTPPRAADDAWVAK